MGRSQNNVSTARAAASGSAEQNLLPRALTLSSCKSWRRVRMSRQHCLLRSLVGLPWSFSYSNTSPPRTHTTQAGGQNPSSHHHLTASPPAQQLRRNHDACTGAVRAVKTARQPRHTKQQQCRRPGVASLPVLSSFASCPPHPTPSPRATTTRPILVLVHRDRCPRQQHGQSQHV